MVNVVGVIGMIGVVGMVVVELVGVVDVLVNVCVCDGSCGCDECDELCVCG